MLKCKSYSQIHVTHMCCTLDLQILTVAIFILKNKNFNAKLYVMLNYRISSNSFRGNYSFSFFEFWLDSKIKINQSGPYKMLNIEFV